MKIVVNDTPVEVSPLSGETRLVDYLREELGLTGVKDACGIGACGACTVLVDDAPVRSCLLRIQDVLGKRILTIEGLAGPEGTLHPLQRSFIEAGAIQCGYCTPGMVLTAHAFLLKTNSPSRQEIRHALRNNLCRCTGYQQIVDAIENAIPYYREHHGR